MVHTVPAVEPPVIKESLFVFAVLNVASMRVAYAIVFQFVLGGGGKCDADDNKERKKVTNQIFC